MHYTTDCLSTLASNSLYVNNIRYVNILFPFTISLKNCRSICEHAKNKYFIYIVRT